MIILKMEHSSLDSQNNNSKYSPMLESLIYWLEGNNDMIMQINRLLNVRLISHPTRSSDYHWIQWLVIGTYIREFLRKKKEWWFGILSDSSFRNHCVNFIAAPKKCCRSIQSWALNIFSVEVFHYFRPRCHDQRRRGLALAQKALFSSTSSTPPSPTYISNPTGTNTIEFLNWLSWEGCGGKLVHETRKDGVCRCPTRISKMFYFSSSGCFRSTKRMMRR